MSDASIDTVAIKFPSLNRYRVLHQRPLLLTGTTPRTRVVLKLDRQESEIIATDVRRTGQPEQLPMPGEN